MATGAELTTVFRSLDERAREQALLVHERLSAAGLGSVILDDSAPGVVEGTYEVRVPAAQTAQAEQLLSADPALAEGSVSEYSPVDPSHELDMVTVFESRAATAEMEATTVESLLRANNIDAMVVGSPTLPVLRFVVRVPRTQQEQARQIIAEAQAAGPAAAEEAALSSIPPSSTML